MPSALRPLLAVLVAAIPAVAAAAQEPAVLRVGVCADPHKDLVHDADERLRIFVERMRHEKVDAILQLGDFCFPKPANDRFLGIWRRFDGPRYHVIGNHEMDEGFTPEDSVRYWGMPGRYYSFDLGAFHFAVLDANDPPEGEARRGYPCGIRPDQLAWLREDLAKADRPVVVCSHQPIGRPGMRNRDEVLAVLRDAKRPDGDTPKVVACFAGHNHLDQHDEIDGIHHVVINSMSYVWLGRDHAHVRYSEEIDRAFPAQKFTGPYEDALYTIVEFDPAGEIRIAGMQSEWVGPSPFELGVDEAEKGDVMQPRISARTLRFTPWGSQQ